MNEMQIFNNEEFGKIRTVTIDNEPWFVGKDVAEALGYKNTKDALINHVAEDDKRIIQRSEIATIENHLPKEVFPMNFVSGEIPNRGLTAINESGLYALIFGSKLESAKRFKHWVTSDVLPTLRKTGQFNMQNMSTEMKALLMHDEKIVRIEREIDDLKNNVPLFTSEATELSRHVRRKGTELLDGKDSEAYKNKVMRRSVFIDIYQQLKREFSIYNDDGKPLSYTAMKRKYIEAAHNFLDNYKPSYVQQEMIEKYNRRGI